MLHILFVFVVAEDDCEGAEADSYHFSRDDSTCRSYYMCNAEGTAEDVIQCDAGKIYDIASWQCKPAADAECYIG